MTKITIKGLAGVNISKTIEVELKESSNVGNAIKEIAKKYPELKQFLDVDKVKPQPGIIVLVNDIDLNLVSTLTIEDLTKASKRNDIEVKIIPVNHGG